MITRFQVKDSRMVNDKIKGKVLDRLETINRMMIKGKLWTTESAKIQKTNKGGIINVVMFLAPADEVASEPFTLCPWAKDNDCLANCINKQGRLGMPNGQDAQLWKTVMYLLDFEAFKKKAIKELKALVRKHGAENLRVRPDGTSDAIWDWLIAEFPNVRFYGYTKGMGKIVRDANPNHWLTFSGSNANPMVRQRTKMAIKSGMRVALALNSGGFLGEWSKPYKHERLLDMDLQDDRTDDPQGTIGLLRRKGSNKTTRLAEEGHGHSFFFTKTQLNKLLLETLI